MSIIDSADLDELRDTNGRLIVYQASQNQTIAKLHVAIRRHREAFMLIINDAESDDGLTGSEAAEIARRALNDEQTGTDKS